ncbi:alpha/beta hydrolase fold domain-containing protein [Phenylobacterium sp.]|uniref:alpha/beta hydrolase fold domain-containing protein n=1 Tax=Phenylobacterium sp. TaxID=1871053 RepID=UPI002C1CC95F|nr:alpha/beta hydrolase fold domain-containing protein [Phenylobacterium sp.]HLZ76934.1 alpha/beta hydrolase fold domain-containing protein [Phenylobacterium sp.]
MDATVFDGQIEQAGQGVRLIDMELATPLGRLRALARRLRFRRDQALITLGLRHGLKLWLRDRAAATDFIARGRDKHARLSAALSAIVDANAVRVAAPYSPLAAPPAPSEWFAPVKGEPDGFVFYVHGGSFIAERSARLTAMVARFAAAANARVFAPSYRLAPEDPCPAAVDDIVAAYRWFRETWPDEPMVALADSAGSAVLLAALQELRDDGDALPDGIVLLSPWVDLSLQSWSVVAASMSGTTGSTMESLALMAHLYLQGKCATDPIASPLYGDFSGFPPMLIHASKGDILFDDAVRLADRMREFGGDLTVRLWEAETHVWEQTSTPCARQSIELASGFIRRCLD